MPFDTCINGQGQAMTGSIILLKQNYKEMVNFHKCRMSQDLNTKP